MSSGWSNGGNKEALVAQVKQWQKTGAGHKQAWYSYVKEAGSTNFDPARHPEAFLQEFVQRTAAGAITPQDEAFIMAGGIPGDKESLVQNVKTWQKLSAGHKQAWYNYVKEAGSTDFDPNRHAEDFLQGFLQGTSVGTIAPQNEAFLMAGGIPGDKDSLVQNVKTWQKLSEGHKQAWYGYCMQMGNPNFDPNRHDVSSLKGFLQGTNSGSISPGRGGAMMAMAGSGKGDWGKGSWGGSKWDNSWGGGAGDDPWEMAKSLVTMMKGGGKGQGYGGKGKYSPY